ncbi:MAG: type VI secretion system-associated protein TagF [Rubrivivax sp.]|nr:type VI secretion system-associated protein TagF [Rubrivivax sp.]
MPGWFGKLSTLGDFASRRVPEVVRSGLDQWLSQVLDGSRQRLGESWLERYLDAPLQRFVLGPGVVDTAWQFGVLMPSCDNVGRYFPLVVLQPRTAPPCSAAALAHLDAWWRRAGEAALETLADSVDVERFERALGDLPPWPAAEPLPAWMPGRPDEGRTLEVRLPVACAASELAQGFVVAEWLRRLEGHSLWWSWRPQEGPTRCRIVTGLPSDQTFADMLAAGD